jgi:hypothetical protein
VGAALAGDAAAGLAVAVVDGRPPTDAGSGKALVNGLNVVAPGAPVLAASALGLNGVYAKEAGLNWPGVNGAGVKGMGVNGIGVNGDAKGVVGGAVVPGAGVTGEVKGLTNDGVGLVKLDVKAGTPVSCPHTTQHKRVSDRSMCHTNGQDMRYLQWREPARPGPEWRAVCTAHPPPPPAQGQATPAQGRRQRTWAQQWAAQG